MRCRYLKIIFRSLIRTFCLFSSLCFTAGSYAIEPDIKVHSLSGIDKKNNISLVWKTNVGSGGQYFFYPAVIDDSIYVVSKKGFLSKITVSDGKVLWRKQISRKLSSGVGSDGRYIAVVEESGNLMLLDKNGKKLWESQVHHEVLAPPLVGYGKIILYASNGDIYTFNESDGSLAWHYKAELTGISLRSINSFQFINDKFILAGHLDGSLLLFDIASGRLISRLGVAYPLGGSEMERVLSVTGEFSIYGNSICSVSFQGQLTCIDGLSGKLIWGKDFSSDTGLVADKRLVVLGDEFSNIFAFHRNTGRLIWKNNELRNYRLSAPLLTKGGIIFGSSKGYVYFLSKENGSIVSRSQTDGGRIKIRPIFVKDNLFIVLTKKGGLFAFQIN